MSSVLNSFIGLNSNADTNGAWENVTVYTTVFVNIRVPAGPDAFSAEVHAQWALSELPTPVAMATDVITEKKVTVQPGTSKLLQIPIKADLFKLIVKHDGTAVIPAGTVVSTMYKDTTSHVILEDRDNENALLNVPADPTRATSLKTRLTDTCGNYISATNMTTQLNAVYTHPDLSINNGTLSVSLPVGSNYQANYSYFDKVANQTVTVSGGHTMLTSVSSSIGKSPAVTAGGGFYYALADTCGYMITSTQTRNLRGLNAINTSLTDTCGYDISDKRPLWVEFTNAPPLHNHEFTVLVTGGTAPNLFTTVDLSNHHIGLRTIGISNLNDTVMWVKVYDISTGAVNAITEQQLTGRVKLNIAVPGYQSRDLNMGKGVNFDHGVYFRVTNDYPYNAASVQSSSVVVTGSYRIMN
jgi:hypothetical protein